LLFLHMGSWNGKQIIPAAWVRDSTRPYSTTNRRTGYGYLWWTMLTDQPSRVSAPPGSYWAEGNGGQIVFVVPAYDLVVVHLARYQSDRPGQNGVSASQALRLIETILAARPAQ
jgi:CubicO group peptidase (beta-lactamase class C family)